MNPRNRFNFIYATIAVLGVLLVQDFWARS